MTPRELASRPIPGPWVVRRGIWVYGIDADGNPVNPPICRSAEFAAYIAMLPDYHRALRIAVEETDRAKGIVELMGRHANNCAQMATEANAREAAGERKIRTLLLAVRVMAAFYLLLLALGGIYVLAR